MSFTALEFHGNESGLFYVKDDFGTEVVPVPFVDTTVTIGYHSASAGAQTIASPEQWVRWLPTGGYVTVAFAEDVPVRTLWVVTNQAGDDPAVIPVWASANSMQIWKQSETSSGPPPFVAGFASIWDGIATTNGGTIFFDTNNGVSVQVYGGQKITPTLQADSGGSIQVLSSGKLQVANERGVLTGDLYPQRLYALTDGSIISQNHGLIRIDTVDPSAYETPGFNAVAQNGGQWLCDGMSSEILFRGHPFTAGTRFTVDGGLFSVTNGATAGVATGSFWLVEGDWTFAGTISIDGAGSDLSSFYSAPDTSIQSGRTLRIQNGATLSRWACNVTENITLDGIHVDCQASDGGENSTAMIGNWQVTPTGRTVAFEDLTFNDGTYGAITSWAWDFGDGGTSSEQNPTYTYAASGTYTVSLTVTVGNFSPGARTIANKAITVA